MKSCLLLIGLASLVASLLFLTARRSVAAAQARHSVTGMDSRNAASSASAFEAIVPVLHNPRCMNCHSRGDFPRQGNDSHPHTMNVRRGPLGDGLPGAQCSTCHQNHNLAGRGTPPGAPDWRMPTPAEPMIWEGLSDRQLCELFKDPKQNGGRTVNEIVEHMNTPLVLWGWHPGDGRTAVPMPHDTFMRYVKQWADNGAACPAESAPSVPR